MHELSVAQSICESVIREVGGARVESMVIEVGALSGVNRDALEFAMPVAAEECGLRLDAFEIRSVPARANCACGHEYEPEDLLSPCPSCSGFRRSYDGGTDVGVSRVVVVEEQTSK
jgi:hydrogenase nickel incorporation protein HypA/HybF